MQEDPELTSSHDSMEPVAQEQLPRKQNHKNSKLAEGSLRIPHNQVGREAGTQAHGELHSWGSSPEGTQNPEFCPKE